MQSPQVPERRYEQEEVDLHPRRSRLEARRSPSEPVRGVSNHVVVTLRTFSAYAVGLHDAVQRSPADRQGVTHSPIVPRCLQREPYGRFMLDPRKSVCVSASTQ